MGFTPKATSSNDTIKIDINDPELYLTQTESISSKLLAENKVLQCLIQKESGWNPEAVGDNGLAFGWYQIHYVINGIILECAKDLECSTLWTISEIEKGNSWKWPTYKKCI